jgi:pantetheine-phosphate adenylyltransferase
MAGDKKKPEYGRIEITRYPKKAVYPGTFDPPTNGHMDVALRASAIFDEVVIAVSDNPSNPSKSTLFSVNERIEMLREIVKDKPNISVKSFNTLLVHFVEKEQAVAIVRGLRAVSDFDYELQLASLNTMLSPSIETVFFMASDENLFVSSSVIKEIAKLGGSISQKLHPFVMKKLKEKLG